MDALERIKQVGKRISREAFCRWCEMVPEVRTIVEASGWSIDQFYRLEVMKGIKQ